VGGEAPVTPVSTLDSSFLTFPTNRAITFESKCDSEACWAYFMAYGVIWSISMSAFVEGALALELPLSRHYVFPTP
jgi:hypothetical protein